MKKKKQNTNYLVYLLILFSIMLITVLYFLYPKVKNKYVDLSLRFRTIERKIEINDRYIVRSIETYQAKRGDASIDVATEAANDLGLWEKLDTPWEEQRYLKTKALTSYNNSLVVGLLGLKLGDAAVYSFDGEWKILGSSQIIPEWKNLDYVQVLREFNNNLIAGIDNQVWMYDKATSSWSQLGADGGDFPWGNGTAYNLVVHNSQLYVGIMHDSPEVYRFMGDHWQNVSDGLPISGSIGVYETWSHSDGKLYAGLASKNDSTSVYVFNDEGMSWTKIGGQGLNGSWISIGFGYGVSFSSNNGWLIVTSTRRPISIGNYSSVWGYDGKEWFPIGASNAPAEWRNIDMFNASLSLGGKLYIGSGGIPSGRASIWELTSHGWALVGGHGVRGSWGAKFPHTLTGYWGYATAEYPYRMIEWNNKMVVGFGDDLGAAQLYLYDPVASRN